MVQAWLIFSAVSVFAGTVGERIIQKPGVGRYINWGKAGILTWRDRLITATRRFWPSLRSSAKTLGFSPRTKRMFADLMKGFDSGPGKTEEDMKVLLTKVLSNRPGFDKVNAVKNHRVYLIDRDIIGGPRWVIGHIYFAKCMRDIKEISGGQQQKVLIARALAQKANILLLDEPTSNLDIRHQLEVMPPSKAGWVSFPYMLMTHTIPSP